MALTLDLPAVSAPAGVIALNPDISAITDDADKRAKFDRLLVERVQPGRIVSKISDLLDAKRAIVVGKRKRLVDDNVTQVATLGLVLKVTGLDSAATVINIDNRSVNVSNIISNDDMVRLAAQVAALNTMLSLDENIPSGMLMTDSIKLSESAPR